MEYNSGSNRASDFKSAERVARGRFEITSTITPELYDTKSYYQLIVSITQFEKLFKSTVEKGSQNLRKTYQNESHWTSSFRELVVCNLHL